MKQQRQDGDGARVGVGGARARAAIAVPRDPCGGGAAPLMPRPGARRRPAAAPAARASREVATAYSAQPIADGQQRPPKPGDGAPDRGAGAVGRPPPARSEAQAVAGQLARERPARRARRPRRAGPRRSRAGRRRRRRRRPRRRTARRRAAVAAMWRSDERQRERVDQPGPAQGEHRRQQQVDQQRRDRPGASSAANMRSWSTSAASRLAGRSSPISGAPPATSAASAGATSIIE